MQSYTVLAKYYDKLMGDFDYKGYVAFVKERVGTQGIDLCCGSGKMTIALANSGRKMIGVDLSADMLNLAVTKSKREGLDILYVNQDIIEFQPTHEVDFVCCVCDGINYIPTEQLPQLFDNIAKYVASGGYFIFDISTAYKLQKILGDNIFCEDHEDVTYIWSNSYCEDSNTLEMQVSFFEKKHHNDYVRIDECHVQYCHEIDYISSLLNKNWVVELLDGENRKAIKKTSRRAMWVCRRK